MSKVLVILFKKGEQLTCVCVLERERDSLSFSLLLHLFQRINPALRIPLDKWKTLTSSPSSAPGEVMVEIQQLMQKLHGLGCPKESSCSCRAMLHH